MNIGLIQYGHNNCLFSGYITNNDFCTDNPPLTCADGGSQTALRIIADHRFDLTCEKNIQTREKNQRFFQEQEKKKSEITTTIKMEDGGNEQ